MVGRVCMDQTMIDVTEIPGVRVGDPVVLLGRQTMRDPNFPIRAAQILRHPEPPIPPAYARAY